MTNYPQGAQNDRRAPWLQEDDEPLWAESYDFIRRECEIFINAAYPETQKDAIERMVELRDLIDGSIEESR